MKRQRKIKILKDRGYLNIVLLLKGRNNLFKLKIIFILLFIYLIFEKKNMKRLKNNIMNYLMILYFRLIF